MATPARVKVKVELSADSRRLIEQVKAAAKALESHDLLPTGDPNPLYDALKAEVARLWLADQLELEAANHRWWRRGQLLAEARGLRGGVL